MSYDVPEVMTSMTASRDGDHVYRPQFSDLDRRYPVTGCGGLFVKVSYTTGIVKIPADGGDAILKFLYQHRTNLNFQARF
jgi:taurine dioxygenase